MIRRPPRSTLDRSSAASDVYKRQDVDSTWIFNEQDSIPATVVGLFPTSVLGVSDTVRVMVSTMNDTIIWSREHGIVMWHMLGEPRYDLVGVQGAGQGIVMPSFEAVSYTHLRAHETVLDLVCRLLLEKKKSTRDDCDLRAVNST